jgi:hypothetical protein
MTTYQSPMSWVGIYRLAQANRLVRWLKSGGDEAEYRAMLGPDSKIEPEPEDIEAAKERST